MFREKGDSMASQQMNGLLEKGCEFEGKLTFEVTVRINGKFSGEVFSEGTLVIGDGAKLDAKIEVGTCIIHGEVSGTLNARERIEMHAPAIVRGEITAQTLVIEEGVLFEGSCSMGAQAASVHSIEEAARGA